MKHEAPNQFLPAASQPQQSLRLHSESSMAQRGPFYKPERKPVDFMKLKREVYDAPGCGLGSRGFGLAYDDRR